MENQKIRKSLVEIAEELGIKTARISNMLKEIAQKFEIAGIDVDYDETFTVKGWYDGSVYRVLWIKPVIQGGKLTIISNVSYSGVPSWSYDLDEYLDYAKEKYSKHTYYKVVHFLASAVPVLIDKALREAREKSMNLEGVISKLKEIISQYE